MDDARPEPSSASDPTPGPTPPYDAAMERLLGAALLASHDAVLLCRAPAGSDDPGDLEYLVLNDAWVRMTGFDRRAAEHHTHLDFGWWADTDQIARAYARMARDGAVENQRVAFRRADGEPGTGLVNAERVTVGGVRYVLATVRDLTDVQREDAAREQAVRDESLGRMAAGVAHDLNNVLAGLHGFAQLVREAPELPGDLRADLDEVLRASDRAAALTAQLLAVGRQQSLRPRPLDVNALVRGVEPLLARVAGAGVAVRAELTAGLPPVYADARQLERVLLNLTTNARDAMPGGGTVTIATAPAPPIGDARASHTPAGGAPAAIALTVADTGDGMPPEVRARAFEPFFTTRGDAGGTGLGLATVHGIVVQSGGTVHLDSAPGAGTRVRVVLPAHAGAAPPRPGRARRR